MTGNISPNDLATLSLINPYGAGVGVGRHYDHGSFGYGCNLKGVEKHLDEKARSTYARDLTETLNQNQRIDNIKDRGRDFEVNVKFDNLNNNIQAIKDCCNDKISALSDRIADKICGVEQLLSSNEIQRLRDKNMELMLQANGNGNGNGNGGGKSA